MGGVILIGFSLAIITYLVADSLSQPNKQAVMQLQSYREHWKTIYGWTYLDRQMAPPRMTPTQKLANSFLNKFKIRAFVLSKLKYGGIVMSADSFIIRHFLSLLFIGTLGWLLKGILGAVLAILIDAFLPFMVLRIMGNSRRAKIEQQLAGTLQIITSLLEAGHGFPQALAAVARETDPPISTLLKGVLAEVSLGATLEDALGSAAKEAGSTTLSWAVTAVKIQREVGGNLSEIMTTLSRSIRERTELTNKIKALTAEGRISAYILIALPFAVTLAVFITNRQYMSLLWTTSAGLTMVAIALVLMSLGIFWMSKIIKIEV